VIVGNPDVPFACARHCDVAAEVHEYRAAGRPAHVARDPVRHQRLAGGAHVDLDVVGHAQHAPVGIKVHRGPAPGDARARGGVDGAAGLARRRKRGVDRAGQQSADATRSTHCLDKRDFRVGAESARGPVDVVEAPAHQRLGLGCIAVVDQRQLRGRPDRLEADRLHEPPDIPAGGPFELLGGVKPRCGAAL
jgi:hypothetical protein